MAAAAAGPATAQRFFRSFSDALIEEDPQAALEELSKALEQKPDDAQCYCQRAYCHILLGNYHDAVADAKKSLELNPNGSTAMLRKGICEYHEKNYAAALETFTEGQKLDSADTDFIVWIKRCEEAQNGSQSEVVSPKFLSFIFLLDYLITECIWDRTQNELSLSYLISLEQFYVFSFKPRLFPSHLGTV